MTPSKVLDIFNDANPVKSIYYTLNGVKNTLTVILSGKAETLHDVEEFTRHSLAQTPSLIVKMLKDFPKQENDKDIAYYENEIAKYYFGELQILSIESTAQENTDSFTQFVINDINQSSKLKR